MDLFSESRLFNKLVQPGQPKIKLQNPSWHVKNHNWCIKQSGGKQLFTAPRFLVVVQMESIFRGSLDGPNTCEVSCTPAHILVCPSKVGGKLYAKEKSQEVAEIAVKHLKSGQTVDKVKSIVAPRQGMLRHSSLY